MSLALSCTAQLSIPQHAKGCCDRSSLEQVKKLLTKSGIPSVITSPLKSLQNGNWVKLICGASFEDLADIRNLSLVYTLSGVDCIDCAAEASVVRAVNDGIEAARAIIPIRKPWVMISINDDDDLHFRKAKFNPDDCPADCARPCENVCPADAISFSGKAGLPKSGVIAERCYGCGRCLPICPYDKIRAFTYTRDVAATAELVKEGGVDAIEIHTSGRQAEKFQELWNGLGDAIDNLRLVAVSQHDMNESTIPVMKSMYETMRVNLKCVNLWQLDGRPMSGDIGRGATREAIKFALRLSTANDKPKGFLQLAGGTNAHTVEGLKKQGLFQTTVVPDSKHNLLKFHICHSIEEELVDSLLDCCPKQHPYYILSDSNDINDVIVALNSSDAHALIGGVAFGGYARKIVGSVLSCLQLECIEAFPDHLLEALRESIALVGTVKCYVELKRMEH